MFRQKFSVGTIWLLGIAFIALPSCTLVLFVLFSALGFQNSPLIFSCATVAVAVALFGACVSQTNSKALSSGIAVIFLLLTVCIVSCSSMILDNSWDGLVYHQGTVILVHDGWNPIRTLHDPIFQVVPPWYNAKGAEFVQAAIYSVTGKIESGKALNLFLALSSFLMSLALFFTLLKGNSYRKSLAVAFALVAAANPVTLVQMPTFYIDGILSSVYLCLLSSLSMLLLNIRSRSAWVGVLVSILLFINLKISAVFLLPVTLLCIVAFSVPFWKRPKRSLQFAAAMIACVLVSLTVGINPYAMNVWHFLRAPIATIEQSKETLKILDICAPTGFSMQYHNQISRLAFSIFSVTNNSNEIALTEQFKALFPLELAKEHANLQIRNCNSSPAAIALPFCFSLGELQEFEACDVRLGGFGPWFGELLVICFGLLATTFLLHRNWSGNRMTAIALCCAGTATLTTFTISHAWWARYAPQFWFVPLFILLAFQLAFRKRTIAVWTTLGGILLLLTNTAIVGAVNWNACAANNKVFREQIELARQTCHQKHLVLKVYVPKFLALHSFVGTRLTEEKLPFEYTEMPPTKEDTCYRITDMPLFIYHAKKS